ncbi:MAG: sugar ABC transporter permease, partial [Bacilli bacterium]|nr:sugar ABC transporter permease [Bacilli bacterium]
MSKATTVTKLKKQENLIGYLFASPWLFGLIVLGIFPIFMSLFFSFTNYNMISAPTIVGFKNYEILFTNDDLFWKSLGNTIYHVVIAVPLGIVVGVGLALLLNNKIRGMGVYRTLFYLPNVVSVVAMTLLWLWLFQPNFGLINELFKPLYDLFDMEPLGWYLDQKLSKLTLILMGLWTAGGSMV